MNKEFVLIPMSNIVASHDANITYGAADKYTTQKLIAVNLIPLFIDSSSPAHIVDEYYARSSGVLLPGGKDLDPSLYGEPNHPTVTKTDLQLDKMSLDLTLRTRQDGKPILGECLGGQKLVVAAGGKLIQHLPEVTKEAHGVSIEKHDDIFPSSVLHDVYISPGTKAHTIFQKSMLIDAPSRHHQSADPNNLGDLIVSGWSPGGIPEIIEHPNLPFHIGVQFHPELVDTMNELFVAFSHAVSRFERVGQRKMTILPQTIPLAS